MFNGSKAFLLAASRRPVPGPRGLCQPEGAGRAGAGRNREEVRGVRRGNPEVPAGPACRNREEHRLTARCGIARKSYGDVVDGRPDRRRLAEERRSPTPGSIARKCSSRWRPSGPSSSKNMPPMIAAMDKKIDVPARPPAEGHDQGRLEGDGRRTTRRATPGARRPPRLRAPISRRPCSPRATPSRRSRASWNRSASRHPEVGLVNNWKPLAALAAALRPPARPARRRIPLNEAIEAAANALNAVYEDAQKYVPERYAEVKAEARRRAQGLR